jgi:hypothetical protein
MKKRPAFHFILFLLFITGIIAETTAQTNTNVIIGGHGYVTMKNGDTLSGQISWRLKYVENNPAEIKFTPDNGSPQVLNASDVSSLSIEPVTDFEGNEIPRQYFVSLPSMNKGIPVFYNLMIDGKVQVFQNRSAMVMTKEKAEVNTEFVGLEFIYSRANGLTVGPLYKTSYKVIESKTRFSSYFVSKDKGPLQKIDKDNYDSVFVSLFGDCPKIESELEKNPDLRKFRNFLILAEVYNQLCR